MPHYVRLIIDGYPRDMPRIEQGDRVNPGRSSTLSVRFKLIQETPGASAAPSWRFRRVSWKRFCETNTTKHRDAFLVLSDVL